ncbi:MAG: hypothetical protein Aurels2KO_41570 [Aureliella sp.]
MRGWVVMVFSRSDSARVLSGDTFVTALPDEIERRRKAAIDAIRCVHGTADDEHGATLFVAHHLGEIDADFWLRHCGVSRPTATQVLDILVLRSHSGGDDDDVVTFDFTLPDDATNYVISVEFDGNGDVSDVSMES